MAGWTIIPVYLWIWRPINLFICIHYYYWLPCSVPKQRTEFAQNWQKCVQKSQITAKNF